jgi:hypothetical protein
MKVFMAVIASVGLVRFGLTLAGVSNDVVKYVSMTAVIAVGTVYYGVTLATWRERMKAAYLLILPYMCVELLALGYGWMTGRPTIFHTPEYSFNTTVPVHFIGHLVGGLTWEPLMLFVIMQVVAIVMRAVGKM